MTTKNLKHWLPVLVWAAIIFFFSSDPDPYKILPVGWRVLRPFPQMTESNLPELIGQFMHFLEYAILAILVSRALFPNQSITTKKYLLIVLLTMIYALTDEIHQHFVPERTFQLFDLFIDLMGTITGSLLYQKKLNKAEQ